MVCLCDKPILNWAMDWQQPSSSFKAVVMHVFKANFQYFRNTNMRTFQNCEDLIPVGAELKTNIFSIISAIINQFRHVSLTILANEDKTKMINHLMDTSFKTNPWKLRNNLCTFHSFNKPELNVILCH